MTVPILPKTLIMPPRTGRVARMPIDTSPKVRPAGRTAKGLTIDRIVGSFARLDLGGGASACRTPMDLHLDFGANRLARGFELVLVTGGLGLRWPILALMSLAIRPQLLFGGPGIGHERGLHHMLMVVAIAANAWRVGLRRSTPWPIAALALVFVLNLLFDHLDRDLSPGFMLESLVLLSLPFAFTQIDLPPRLEASAPR